MNHTLFDYATEYRVSVRRFTEIDIVAYRRKPLRYVHVWILLDENDHVVELKAYNHYMDRGNLVEEKLYAYRYTSNRRWIFILNTVEKWLKEV